MSSNATLGTGGPGTGAQGKAQVPRGLIFPAAALRDAWRSWEGRGGRLGLARGTDMPLPELRPHPWPVGGTMSGPRRPARCLSVSGRGPGEGCPPGQEARDAPPPMRSSRTRTGSGR